MALKIQNEIGCDQGITSEAYIRINQYHIDKQNGSINLNYSAYFNQSAATFTNNYTPINRPNQPIRNIILGENLNIPLRKDVIETITTTQKQLVQKEVTRDVTTTIDGVATTTSVTSTEAVMKDVPVTNTVTKSVPDLSQLYEVDIFKFSYDKLKEKLLVNFDNIVDC